MRARMLSVLAALAALPNAAVNAQSTPATDPQLAQLQQQLALAQQEIQRLQGLLVDAGQQTAALQQCREKNGRLVDVGNALIAAFEQRYRRSAFMPFQIGRRKFEAELQSQGDIIHSNKVDALSRQGVPESGTASPQDTVNENQTATEPR